MAAARSGAVPVSKFSNCGAVQQSVFTSQAISSDQQWAAARATDGAATTMPERRPIGIYFSSTGSWQLFLARTHLGYYSTAVEACDAWRLNCAEVAVEEVEAASADAVSAYQRAAAAVATAIDGKAALRAQHDALAEAAEQAYPALFAARQPAAALRRRLAARRPVSKLLNRSLASMRS